MIAKKKITRRRNDNQHDGSNASSSREAGAPQSRETPETAQPAVPERLQFKADDIADPDIAIAVPAPVAPEGSGRTVFPRNLLMRKGNAGN